MPPALTIRTDPAENIDVEPRLVVSPSGLHRLSPGESPDVARGARGFTLIELVIVMVIIGVLAATASPQFYDQARTKLDVTKTRLIADMSYAREIAVEIHGPVSVKFNVAGNSYQIYNSTTGAAVSDPSDLSRNLSFSLTGQSFSGGVAISSASIAGTPGLRFNSWGSPTDTSGNTQATTPGLIVLTSGSYTDTIRVEARTGYVR